MSERTVIPNDSFLRDITQYAWHMSDLNIQGEDGHPKMNRRRWLQGLGLAGAAGLAGCMGGNSTETPTGSGEDGTPTMPEEIPEVGGTYQRTIANPAETLNPLYNNVDGVGDLIGYALDMGYSFKPGTEFMPQLYDLSTDNGEVWVAELRDNLMFGGDYERQVTAEDFVYQVQEVHQGGWAGTPDAANWPTGEGGYNVEQTGDLEFQIELPNANLLYPESYEPLLYPIPKEIMEKYASEENAEGLQQDQDLLELTFTGNLGAYQLDEWNRGSEQIFTRSENYYLRDATDEYELFENAPYFEGIDSRVVQESQNRLGALETGDSDVAAIPPNRVSEFQEMDNVEMNISPTPFLSLITWNMRDNGWNTGPGNLFRKKSFRQGLACAVSKQQVVEGIYRGFAEPAHTFQPEWSSFYPEDDSGIETFGVGDLYGPEPAQSRIEDATEDTDYDYDDNGRLLNPDGDQCTITLYYNSNSSTNQSLAEFIAGEYEENAGIVVETNAIQSAQFQRNYFMQEEPGDDVDWTTSSPYNRGPRSVTSAEDWDMSILFGYNTYPLNPTVSDVFFLKKGTTNPQGYYPQWNAKELYNQASSATSDEALQEALSEIFVNLNQAQPIGMLTFSSDTYGYSDDIWGPIEDYFTEWNFAAWFRDD